MGAIVALQQHSFLLFFGSFMVLFTGAGIGNGATYRMIPAVFRAGITDPDASRSPARPRPAASASPEAVGAYGGFFIPRGFAMAKESFGSLVPALWVFVAAYLLMALTTYVVYQRKGSALAAETI